MKNVTSEQKQSNLLGVEANNSPSTSSQEIIQLEGKPFAIVHDINDQYFGVVGRTRVTRPYDDVDECKAELDTITWDKISAVIYEMVQIHNNSKL